MVVEVIETDPGEKGNTAQGASKVGGWVGLCLIEWWWVSNDNRDR